MDLIQEKQKKIEEMYGTDLLSYSRVAEIIGLKTDSIRAICGSTIRKEQPWVKRLQAGKVRMGRRVFFQSWAVARVWRLGNSPLTPEEERLTSEGAVAAAPSAQNPCPR
ncbi:hypothetical protein BJI67_12830 [Acidihalobacter aeolianus]|uniref:Uncharacterized protein n=1 Tax=Acidihalobacter aeolianus TaxID=2792603 RepID=A0A1D8KA55_9GAMM|nr:hypothetical protein BJI67_12830 [Acidihalobacter aeolianus]